mgnify:CR=1 FL=1
MKTVFLFIYHHSHIADLLHTNYIKYLSEKYKVVVITPQREGDHIISKNKIFTSPNIIYAEFPLEHAKWWRRFKLLRASCVRQFDNLLSVQINYKRTRVDDKRRVVLRAVSLMLPRFITSTAMFTWLETFIIPASKIFDEYAEKYKPSIILTATPGFTHFEAWAIILAKKSNIPTAAINFTWDNLTSNGKLIRKTDYLIVWNEIIKKEAKEYHNYSTKDVFVSGPIRFDNYFNHIEGEMTRENFLKSKNLDPARKTVLITTMSKNNYPYHKELVQSIISIRDSNSPKKRFNIFIRVHPIDSFEIYSDIAKANYENLYIERAGKQIKPDSAIGQKVRMDEEDMLNLKHTLMYSDICINPFSTISLESMIFDKPVINIGLDPEYRPALNYVHYKPLLDKKAVKVAYTEKQLEDYIDLYLTKPETDQENRKKIVKDFIGFTDGLSYKRNADFLEEIFKK